MKPIVIILLLLLSRPVAAQQCTCESDSSLMGLVICDTTIFDNKAMLFWNYNCDSSWLTFKDPEGNDTILCSWQMELMEFTGELDYAYFSEFKSFFLVGCEQISGCCAPMVFYLHDKTNGKRIKHLGEALYTSSERSFPYAVSFAHAGYEDTLDTDYNILIIYNLDTGKEARMQLPKGEIEKAIEENNPLNYQDIFDETVITGQTIRLKYVAKIRKNGKVVKYKTILIDFKQLGL